MADDLSAQGSGLRARQTKGSPHAPGKTHSDASSKPQIVDLHFLAQGLEETGSLFVGKEVQQPKQFPVDASGRGDYRRQEGVTQTLSHTLSAETEA